MRTKKLIIFEGIDNSGKTTMSREFLKVLNDVDPEGGWAWSKEPDFSTEEADRLNDKSLMADEYKREALFLESRGRRQDIYKQSNMVVDRYLWTGLAYAQVFSPSVYPFVKELYKGNLFLQPDLYVFVDTPVAVCDERDPSVGFDRLNSIREAYLNNMGYLSAPVVTCQSVGTVEESMRSLMESLHSKQPDLFQQLRLS